MEFVEGQLSYRQLVGHSKPHRLQFIWAAAQHIANLLAMEFVEGQPPYTYLVSGRLPHRLRFILAADRSAKGLVEGAATQ